MIPESPVTPNGWKASIDKIHWPIGEIRHNIADSGFTSQLTLETAMEA